MNIGYEYHNSLLVLNTLAFLLLFIIIKFVIFILSIIILKIAKKCGYKENKRSKSYLKKLKRFKNTLGEQLFYGDVIALIMGAFFEITISTIYTF